MVYCHACTRWFGKEAVSDIISLSLGILSVGFNRFGSEQKLLDDPIHHLFEVYVEINRIIAEEKEIEKKKAEDAGEKQVC